MFDLYKNAFNELREAVNRVEPDKLMKAGIIKTFEFTFELAWKLMKRILDKQGIDCDSPKSTIKEAYKFGLIDDGDTWIEMLEDRNLTTYPYGEDFIEGVYSRTQKSYVFLFGKLLKEFEKYV